MRALLELDARYALNQFRALLRSPGRLAIWIPYIALAVGLGGWRLTAPRLAGQAGNAGDQAAFATLAGGAFLTAIGFAVARHAAGRVQIFRCKAEALLCVDAGVRPATLVGWLQMRKVTGTVARWAATLLLYAGAFAPANAQPDALVRVMLGAGAAALTLASLEIPAFLGGRSRFGNSLIVAGWALCVAGSLQALAGVVALFGDAVTGERILYAFGFDAGAGVRAIASGATIPLLAFVALPLVPSATLALFGNDVLPELFEGSLQPRSRTTVKTRADAADASFAGVPPGGLAVLFWKDYVCLKRAGGLTHIVSAFAAWAAFGTILAGTLGKNSELSLALIALANLIVALVPVALTGSLAENLANPLWWLAPGTLYQRLSLWTLSRAWPGGIALSGLPIALGLSTGHPGMALLGPPGALLLWWSMYALALALYAALPGRFDFRGPFGLVRVVTAVAYLYPPLWAFGAAQGAFGDTLAGASAAACVLGLQGYLALGFAERRLARGGVTAARLEAAP